MTPVLAPTLEECLDRPAAARYLNVSPATLAAWAVSGRHRIPFTRYGKRCLYRRGDLEKFLSDQFEPAGK
jgi:excisionase family DNA binding protein